MSKYQSIYEILERKVDGRVENSCNVDIEILMLQLDVLLSAD